MNTIVMWDTIGTVTNTPRVELLSLTRFPRVAGLNDETGLYEWQPKGLRVFEVTSPDPGSDVAAVQQGKISITPMRTAFVAA